MSRIESVNEKKVKEVEAKAETETENIAANKAWSGKYMHFKAVSTFNNVIVIT